MAEAQELDEQEAASRHHRSEGTSRWRQGGAGGGAGGLGRMARADSGEHRVEGKGQGIVEGGGASSSEEGLGKGHGKIQGV